MCWFSACLPICLLPHREIATTKPRLVYHRGVLVRRFAMATDACSMAWSYPISSWASNLTNSKHWFGRKAKDEGKCGPVDSLSVRWSITPMPSLLFYWICLLWLKKGKGCLELSFNERRHLFAFIAPYVRMYSRFQVEAWLNLTLRLKAKVLDLWTYSFIQRMVLFSLYVTSVRLCSSCLLDCPTFAIVREIAIIL